MVNEHLWERFVGTQGLGPLRGPAGASSLATGLGVYLEGARRSVRWFIIRWQTLWLSDVNVKGAEDPSL